MTNAMTIVNKTFCNFDFGIIKISLFFNIKNKWNVCCSLSAACYQHVSFPILIKPKSFIFLCVNYNIICIYFRISILLVYIFLSIHKMSCHSMQSYWNQSMTLSCLHCRIPTAFLIRIAKLFHNYLKTFII